MNDERPWLKNYPKGIPANIDADAYPNLVALLEETFEKYRKLPAFSCMGKEITFDYLDHMSAQFGAYLHSRGLVPGDRIALMMPNMLQYPIALFGALRAGLVVVNTNPLYTPREMEHQFTDSGVKAIVIAENFAANLEKIIGKTEINTVILTSIGELLGAVKGTIVNFVVRNIKKMVPKFNIANTVTFSEALKQGKKFVIKEFTNEPDRVIIHQYTGGTTGVAKGAMLTNRNLVANMQQIRAWMMPYLKEKEEIALSPLPMYHIFAFTVNALALMSIGTRTVLITNPRDLSTVVGAFKDYKVTLMTGINTLFNALVNNDDFAKQDFSSLKITVGGGMAVQRPVAEKWQQVTGCVLSEGYGMTESSPVATINPLDGTGRMGTIGLPVSSTDIRIVDVDTGSPLPIGSTGEIQIKGPQVMKGYYNRPEETNKTIKDGWLCTGDIGVMSEDGFIQIVDRKKDMILVSGFNVYPNEVEEVVAAHPKVLEAAAVGIPSDKSGEVVKLFVVKKDKSLKEKELMEYCRENLTGYKVPKEIEFRTELPKTNVGKILRRKLRDE
ncbi:AMP-binding protein [Flavilitoribacter nigricans]|uniref:Long-chain-fatty-acid--CoA ligase n=1 Tax=Flavilitoribacter nigricans (strain ATCC 23147 / DSM 23189 / NBRC 102662 / NCIMB 1420 / SS-2) TaxID=1122177 RepID=A0A2D0N445_FLAN2|nr:AMP-binding protein [Flavilitoribacter nigricans]PHN03265.1 long-chain-fatty-acid--CoA ligase [Flavilitoribacter nigricans DSM 23189 = NBRC 102662]